MIDSNSQFFAILTAVGEAKQANATALGIPWTFKEMAVGDANGTDPVPDRIQKRLINEWRRAPVNQVRTDPANPNIIITEQVIPADVGGKWIREIALYDADGDMVAVANCAPSFKPLLAQGTGKTQIIRMNFIVTNTSQVVLKIDPAVVLATRDYVDTAIIDVLPPNKVVGSFRKVTINSRGIVQSGSNPTTLAEYGLDIPTQEEAEAQSGQNNTKPLTVLRVFQAIVKKLGLATQASVTDATPGKLMTVGAGGLMSTVEPFQDANAIPYRTGFFGAAGVDLLNCPPLAKSGDMIMQMVYNVNAAVQQWYGYSTDVKYFRRRSVGVWSEWKEDVHTGNQTSSLPVGSMLVFPKGAVPAGFLEVDGSVQSAATYPDLFAYLGNAFNTGGEGAGNFRLPDSRGEFLRGWDHGRGVDAGRALGSYQSDELKSHTHSIKTKVQLMPQSGSANSCWTYETDGQTGATGGSETRPRNLAVMWCIKAWNATVNQGSIDIAALAAQVAGFVPRDYQIGMIMSMSGAAPTTTVEFSAGSARGTGNAILASTAISCVLQSAGVWSAGSGGNKIDAGVRAANTWYHAYVIRKNDGGERDMLFSTGAVVQVPAGYELIARLKGRSIKTDVSGNIIPFINTGNSTDFKTMQQDMLVSSVLTNSYTLTVSVPPGVRARARFYARMQGESSVIYVRSPESAVVTLANTVVAGFVGGIGTSNDATSNENVSGYCEAMTSPAGQVVVQVYVYPGYTGGFASLHTQGWTEE